MSGFVGADASGLDRLATQFGQGADALEQMASRLGSHLHTVNWHGGDADRARHDWNNTGSRVIATTVTELRKAVLQLQAQAREQRAASGSDGGQGGVASVLAAGRIQEPRRVTHTTQQYSGGIFHHFTSSLHTLERGADDVGRGARHAADEMGHGAKALAGDFVAGAKAEYHEAARIQHEIVTSPEFEEVVSVSHGVATLLADAAPMVALIPGAQGVAAGMAVAAVAAQAIYLAGSALEMANHVQGVTAGTLIGGTVDLAVDAAGAGSLSLSAHAAGGLQDAELASKAADAGDSAKQALALQDVLPHVSPEDAARAVKALQAVPLVVDGSSTADDLAHRHYADAVGDGLNALGDGVGDHLGEPVADGFTLGNGIVNTVSDGIAVHSGTLDEGDQ